MVKEVCVLAGRVKEIVRDSFSCSGHVQIVEVGRSDPVTYQTTGLGRQRFEECVQVVRQQWSMLQRIVYQVCSLCSAMN